MDGVEAMHRIRQDAAKANKEVCIVALTANAISSAREMFLSEGFDGFIPKPIQIAELERVLKRVLPRSAIVYSSAPGGKAAAYADHNSDADTPAAKRSSDDNDDVIFEFEPESGDDTVFEFEPEGGDDTVFEFEPVGSDDTAAESDASGPASDIITALKDLGIDTDKGIAYCAGDADLYKELLADYSGNSENKISELNGYYEDRDIKNYTIKVHAIKSTSALIGANAVSEKAKALEAAAKEENEDFITDNHKDLIDDYKKLMDTISGLLG